MAFVRQAALVLLVLIAALAAWIRFDPAPAAFLTAEDGPLPGPLRSLVAAIAPAETQRIGATPTREAPPAPLVLTDAARPDVTRDSLGAIGTGEAERSVALYPEVAGIVSTIAFSPGDLVEPGAVLATLQDEDERLALDRARIVLDAAEAQVERFRALSGSAAITQVQLDEVLRAADTARLDLRAAEVALERRRIVSPIEGRVGLTAVQPGALVGTDSLIATVDDRSQLKIVFNAPEAFVPGLSVGQAVEASPTTRNGRTYSGEISALDSRIDEASRTLRVEVLVDNGADELRPGMSFSVEVGFPGETYLSIDPLAVQWEREGAFVWVVRDGAVEKETISIVERNIDRVLVASDGLADGEAVVVEGVAQLREGLAVRLLEPARGPEPEPASGAPSAEAAPEADQRADGPSPGSARLANAGGAAR